ncbi:unnamed protein product, partial [Prorocentrum cordatum]
MIHMDLRVIVFMLFLLLPKCGACDQNHKEVTDGCLARKGDPPEGLERPRLMAAARRQGPEVGQGRPVEVIHQSDVKCKAWAQRRRMRGHALPDGQERAGGVPPHEAVAHHEAAGRAAPPPGRRGTPARPLILAPRSSSSALPASRFPLPAPPPPPP